MVSAFSEKSFLDPQLDAAKRLYQAVLFFMVLYLPLYAFIGRGILGFVAPVIIVICCAVALIMHNRRATLTAMRFFVWGLWCAVTVQALLRNGLANPVLFAFPALFLLGGWVLGFGQGLLIAVASILAVFVLTFLQHFGWLLERVELSAIQHGIPLVVVLSASILAMRYILRQQWESVDKTRELNRQLNQTLAEQRLREREIEKSEKRFQTLTEASPLPVGVWSRDTGRCLKINPAWERTFGFSEKDILGKTSMEIGFWTDQDSRSAWLEKIKESGCVVNYPVEVYTAQGERRNSLMFSQTIDYDEHPCTMSTHMDVTDRLKLEVDLKDLNERLEQRVQSRTKELEDTLQKLVQAQNELIQKEKLAALGYLVAGVAHELNTPLGNAITTNSTHLDLTKTLSEKFVNGKLTRSDLEHYLGQSREATELTDRSLVRTAELVKSFKQVAVDQSSDWQRTFDLAEVVTEVVDTLRPNLKTQPWKIKVSIPSGIKMSSYPGPLGQIIMNLVMNASIHAFHGRTEGLIHLSAIEGENNTVTLMCEDNGTGIPEENLNRIFDPFFTTRLGKGGSGLGLSIVHRLCTEILQGQISVTSTLGNGSCFRLDIPLDTV